MSSHVYIESLGLTLASSQILAAYPLVTTFTETKIFEGLAADPSVTTKIRFEPEIRYILTQDAGKLLLESGFPVEVEEIEQEEQEDGRRTKKVEEPVCVYSLVDSALKVVSVDSTMQIVNTPQFIEMASASPRNHEILSGKIASYSAQYNQYISTASVQQDNSEELDNSLSGNAMAHNATLELNRINKENLRQNMASILKWFKDKLFTPNNDDDIDEEVVEILTPSEALELYSKYHKGIGENELLETIRDAAQNALTSI